MRTGSLAMRMAVFFCSIIKLLRISTKTLYCSSTTPVAQMLLIRCILGVRSLRSMFFNVWHEIKYAHLTNTYKALIFNTIHTTSFLATQNCSIKSRETICQFKISSYFCIALEENLGRLAQLVQSICLTSRGSAVRIRQRPHKYTQFDSLFLLQGV